MTPTAPKATTDRGGPCPYCTNPLPVGRALSFCPHCGMNVVVAQCPACSSDVEPGWHYCVTCGRDVSALPQPSTAPPAP